MSARLLTLARHSAVYGLGSVVSKVAALLLLPLYTRYLGTEDFGRVELILSGVMAIALITQLGLVNSFFRFFFDDETDHARRQLFSTVFWTLLLTGLAAAAIVAALAEPLADALLGSATREHVDLVRIGAVGIWTITNYQLMAALFRVQQRPLAFTVATLCNLTATVALTVWFVVFLDWGSTGLLLGNFGGSLIVYAALLVMQRAWLRRPKPGELRPLLAFGLPMVPAAAALWVVNLANRPIIASIAGLGAVGVFAVAFKLSQAILLIVTAFQLSWPAFAHSIKDDQEARTTYAAVLSFYFLVLAWPVLALGVLAPWLVRVIATPEFYAADDAVLPLAIGAALYGAYFIASIAVARVKKTQFNWVVAAVAGLVEVVLLYALTPTYGVTGAAWACTAAYAAMFVLMLVHGQRHFHIPYQWPRVARVVLLFGASATTCVLLVPAQGAAALATRLAIVALFPLAVLLSGFFTASERQRLGRLMRLQRVA